MNESMVKRYTAVMGEKLTADELINKPLILSQREKLSVRIVSGKRILDIGCLFGDVSAATASNNSKNYVIAIDRYIDHVNIAAHRFKYLPNLAFCQGNVYDLGFKDEYFDSILFLEVIEHLTHPVKALQEINRVLTMNGQLVISTYNAFYWKHLVKLLLGRYNLSMYQEDVEWSRHIFCWTLDTLYTLLRENGFDLKGYQFLGLGLIPENSRLGRWSEEIFRRLASRFGNTMILECLKVSPPTGRII